MRPRILVIDDDEANLRIVEEFLEDAGYQPILADSGRQGLELLSQTGHIKMVLLDWMMPEMDGMQVLEAIRHDKTFADIPVIMLTALDKKEKVAESIQNGADNYIVKPFGEEVLIKKVRDILLGTGSIRKKM